MHGEKGLHHIEADVARRDRRLEQRVIQRKKIIRLT
jgi:hypothetical protein